MFRWLKEDLCLGLVTIPKRPLRNALGGTLRAILSASLGGSPIEDKDVKKRDPFYKEKAIHYVHKNKRKYNRKNKHKQSDV